MTVRNPAATTFVSRELASPPNDLRREYGETRI